MIRLRSFEPGDVNLIFKWRNDPYIVNLGSLKQEVSWEEHLKWFEATLNNNERKAFVIEIDGVPSGQVRFDLETSGSSCISIYLLEEFSGRGYGIESMKLACSTIFEEWKNMDKIYAFVRTDNPNGQKAFLKAGFTADHELIKENHFSYLLKRN